MRGETLEGEILLLGFEERPTPSFPSQASKNPAERQENDEPSVMEAANPPGLCEVSPDSRKEFEEGRRNSRFVSEERGVA